MSDFWNELTLGMHKGSSSLDAHLGKRASKESVRSLTDRVRGSQALALPVEAGTRVLFANNLGAVLTYPEPPDGNSEGTVVTVRSASGDLTHMNDLVFVKWDSGQFLPVHREHLRASKSRVASAFSMRVSCVGDLTDFMKTSKDELVHMATKDLWSMRKDGNAFVIERLFDETGNPLKV